MPVYDMRPVIQMDMDGNFIKEFHSVRAAAAVLGGTSRVKAGIYRACSINPRYIRVAPELRKRAYYNTKGLSDTYGGYRWKFKETL